MTYRSMTYELNTSFSSPPKNPHKRCFYGKSCKSRVKTR